MAKKYFVSSVLIGGALLLTGAGCSTAPVAPATPTEETAATTAEQTPTPVVPVKEETTPPATPVKETTRETTESQPAAMAPAEKIASPTALAVKEFTLTAKKWEFNPGTITVNKGDQVRLKITSLDVVHGFTLSDFNIKLTLNPNVTQTIEFVADKTGAFPFFCSVYCGDGHGQMRGALIVQ